MELKKRGISNIIMAEKESCGLFNESTFFTCQLEEGTEELIGSSEVPK